jgi:hypothetical protein
VNEDLDKRIQGIEKVINYSIFQGVEPYTLIGDNHLMEQNDQAAAGHTIYNTGDGIVTVGNENNVVQVQQKHQDVSEKLIELVKTVNESDELTAEQKFEVGAEIETVQAQLKKIEPNTTVLQAAFDAMDKILIATGCAKLLFDAAVLLGISIPS